MRADPLRGERTWADRGRAGADLGELHETLARTGDAEVRNRLLVAYDGLARKLASRLSRRNHQYEDLTQVARMGLLKALDRFDPRRGVAFTTYGWQVAQGELKRHLRDHSWALHVPRGAKERYFEVRQSNEELQHELGRSPTIPELAEELGMSDEDVVEAIEISHVQRPTSIDGATTDEAFEGLCGFDQMVVFEIAFLGYPMLPHVVGNLVARPGRGHDGLGIQFTDAPGRKDGGVHAVGREEFEEAPDADASAKLAFGELHGRLVTGTPQEHGVEINGQVHGHAYARRVGKVRKVHMPRAIALGSLTEFLEFMLHRAGHLDLLSAPQPGAPSPAASVPAR